MKLKNSALQELYDTIFGGTVTFTVDKDSPIDEAFKKCDEKLSESATFAHIKDLQERNDVLWKSNQVLLSSNIELAGEKRRLEKDLDDAKERLDFFTHSSDNWRSRAKHAEEAVNKANADREELQKNLDYYFNKYQELKKDYETVMKKRNDLSKEVVDLKARLNSVYVAATCMPEDYHKDGMYEVWRKLREVADATSSELLGCFADVCKVDDLIEWNLEDFMDEYKKWQEKKGQERTKYMQDYLEMFCLGKSHFNCPLNTDGFVCGRGRCFYDMTDEDLKKHYEKARACDKPS